MTACPRCGAKGAHETLTLTCEGRMRVGHVCTSVACMLEWTEEARDPEAALAAFGWPRRDVEGRS